MPQKRERDRKMQRDRESSRRLRGEKRNKLQRQHEGLLHHRQVATLISSDREEALFLFDNIAFTLHSS
jgi:hypothetical protein